ncbi:hypothetical protein [uncultured Marinobacter sp.]|uniref:hypothetical protein n=1 Tax=uncultured Marinobacter sp. TaxID=187379 RepID=UPI0030DB20B6|tara:strand:- start:2265 stop:2801 length:537 start_codon:yes stop_codon:yes gene_type:complete
MFHIHDSLNYVKKLAHLSEEDLTLCQRIESISIAFGFPGGWFDLRSNLPRLPEEKLKRLQSEIAKRYCEISVPSPHKNYYLLSIEGQYWHEGITAITHWVGHNSAGSEIRAPRPLRGGYDQFSGRFHYDDLRKHIGTHFVIETESELFMWLNFWRGSAYVAEDLAKESLGFLFRMDVY